MLRIVGSRAVFSAIEFLENAYIYIGMSRKEKKKPKKAAQLEKVEEPVTMHLHRGRIQAQGKHLEESERWGQDVPLNVEDGIQLSRTLENRLTHRDREIRLREFEQCRTFMRNASENGGYTVTNKSKSFYTKTPPERVDIELFEGIAFVPMQE